MRDAMASKKFVKLERHVESEYRKMGFSEKQIKALMNEAKKDKVTAAEFVKIIIVLRAWAFVVASILAETTLFKKPKRANSITRLGRHIRQPKKTGEELIA